MLIMNEEIKHRESWIWCKYNNYRCDNLYWSWLL